MTDIFNSVDHHSFHQICATPWDALPWDGGRQLNNDISTSEIQHFHSNYKYVKYTNSLSGNMYTKWCSFLK